MNPSVPVLLAASNTAGGALSASAVATSILHGSGKFNLGGGSLQAGSLIKLIQRGVMGVGTTVAGTITFDLRIGSAVITSFAAQTVRSSSSAAVPFTLEIDATMSGNSTAAVAIATATFTGQTLVGSTNMVTAGAISTVIASSAGTAFDATAGGLIDSYATWGVSTSGNTIQTYQSELWLIG